MTDNIDKVAGSWVNIGMGEKETNLEIRELMEHVSKKKLRYKEGAWKEQPHHSSVWFADNRKLKSLGWKPLVGLAEGLKRTWKYYETEYRREVEGNL